MKDEMIDPLEVEYIEIEGSTSLYVDAVKIIDKLKEITLQVNKNTQDLAKMEETMDDHINWDYDWEDDETYITLDEEDYDVEEN